MLHGVGKQSLFAGNLTVVVDGKRAKEQHAAVVGSLGTIVHKVAADLMKKKNGTLPGDLEVRAAIAELIKEGK